MRVLKFIVDKDVITPDPSCDFSGLFPGKEDKVRAEFTFSPDWKNRVKVAAFWSLTGVEYEPKVINDDGSCMIPVEALKKVAFKVQVLGKHRDVKIQSNRLTVYQSGNRR